MSKLALNALAKGDKLPPLALGKVNRTTLALFAGASGDHNPIHIDVAKQARVDDVFAHGMLSMAYLERYITGLFDQRTIKSFAVRFQAMTQVHDDLECHGEVAELTEIDGETCARFNVCIVRNNEDASISGSADIRIA